MPHGWPVSEPAEVHLGSGSAQLWIDLRGGAVRRPHAPLPADGGAAPLSGDVGRIGHRAFDTLTDLERDDDRARVRLTGPAGRLERAVDQARPWLQVHTGASFPEGRRRRSPAVEPMTSSPDAPADSVDPVVLEPGAVWSGTWTLAWTAGG